MLMNKPLTPGVVAVALVMMAGGRANATDWGPPAVDHSAMMAGLTVNAAASDPAPPPLIDENFNSVATRPVSNANVGTMFTATSVGVGGTGSTTGHAGICVTPASGRCAWLNQSAGVLTSVAVTLEPNTDYLLSFDALRSNANTTAFNPMLTVTLGPGGSGSVFQETFTLTASTPGIVKDESIRVPTAETVQLRFTASPQNNSGTNGPVIDNVSLVQAPAVATPEPASLGLMVLGLLGGAGFAARKRRS